IKALLGQPTYLNRNDFPAVTTFPLRPRGPPAATPPPARRKRAMGAVECHRMSGIRKLDERDFDALLSLFERVAGERRWIGTEPGFDREQYRRRWRKM